MTLHWWNFWGRRGARIEESRKRTRTCSDEYTRLKNQRTEVSRISSAIFEVQDRNHIAEQVSRALRRA